METCSQWSHSSVVCRALTSESLYCSNSSFHTFSASVQVAAPCSFAAYKLNFIGVLDKQVQICKGVVSASARGVIRLKQNERRLKELKQCLLEQSNKTDVVLIFICHRRNRNWSIELKSVELRDFCYFYIGIPLTPQNDVRPTAALIGKADIIFNFS